MATAQEFIQRIDNIEGVAGCLLIRNDGRLHGQTLTDLETYSNMLVVAGGLADGVMESAGFSCCRYLCFHRTDEQHFYIFPIDRFLLGVAVNVDCSIPTMLKTISRLIGRVSTGQPDQP